MDTEHIAKPLKHTILRKTRNRLKVKDPTGCALLRAHAHENLHLHHIMDAKKKVGKMLLSLCQVKDR